MCPSIVCPSCGDKTFHKGRCENIGCLYDPLNGPWVSKTTPNQSASYILADLRIETTWADRPFPRLQVRSSSEEAIQDLADFIGYRGRIIEDDTDVFSGRLFTFDIVKDRAQEVKQELDGLAKRAA